MFLPILVLTFVAGIVWPNLFTFAVLLVLKPVALVACSIRVVVLAIAVGLVVFPLSVVDVAIGVNESSTSIRFVCLPVAFVERAVDPDLDTSTVFPAHVVPLAFVLGSVVKCHKGSLDSIDTIWLGVGLILEWLQLVPYLHDETACLHNLRIVRGVSGVWEHVGLCDEAILVSHYPPSDLSPHVSLDRDHGRVLGSLRVLILDLTPDSSQFLRVEFLFVTVSTATGLSHLQDSRNINYYSGLSY